MEFLLEMDFLSMTDGYSKRNCWDETWKLFDSMSVEGNVEPEELTMIAARSACSQKGGLRLGKSFHEYVKLEMQVTMNVNVAAWILQEGSLIPWELEMCSLGRAWLMGMLKAVS